MDNQSKAEVALNTALQSGMTTIPLVFPNFPYDPSVTDAFIRVAHRPGYKRQASLGKTGLNLIEGIMVLYVSYPVSNEHVGTHSANTTAGQLIALFGRGSTFTYGGDDDDDEVVMVTCNRSQRTGALESESRYTPMVEVSWYAYVSNETGD